MTSSNQASWMTRVGATPGKLALIGVLAVVLAYVVISQLPGSTSRPSMVDAATPSRRTPRRQTRSNITRATRADSQQSSTPRTAWPKPNVDQAVARDPFAMPAWARNAMAAANKPISTKALTAGKADAQAVVASQVKSMSELKAKGATVIMVLDGQPLALVGDRQIRIGDQLQGYTVKDITESGIVLASEGQSQ